MTGAAPSSRTQSAACVNRVSSLGKQKIVCSREAIAEPLVCRPAWDLTIVVGRMRSANEFVKLVNLATAQYFRIIDTRAPGLREAGSGPRGGYNSSIVHFLGWKIGHGG